MGVQEWREQMREYPVKSCGRLDMATYMPDEVTVGRVTSDRVRYVYFEDGSEVICLGQLCDHVAFRAADYAATVAAKDAEIARLREALEWYADPELYDFQSGCDCDLCRDTGAPARAALGPEYEASTNNNQENES